MSGHNSYRIHIDGSADDLLIKQFERKLDKVFKGHYEETEYGFYAEDSPYAGAVFEDNPRYVTPSDLRYELNTDWVWDWNVREELDDDPEVDSDKLPIIPSDSEKQLSDIVTKCIHYSENDTSGKSGEEDITAKF